MRDPEQRLDPPEMTRKQEYIMEQSEYILDSIETIHNKAENFFEELTVAQLEKMLYKAEDLLEELQYLEEDDFLLDDEIRQAKSMIEDIESWIHEKEDLIKTEGDK
jgi:mevalonate kinase